MIAMDGCLPLIRRARCRAIRRRCAECCIAALVLWLATGDVGAQSMPAAANRSSRRDALTRFDGPAELHSVDSAIHSLPAARRPVSRIRPAARLIDARQSPLVAVVSAVGSNPKAQSLPTTEPASAPAGDAVNSSATTEHADRPATVEEALATRGSVTFRKTPISEVVFLLSDLWNINIVAGADVTGEVSGAFQDAPLSEVLSAALTASGYGYRQMGSSLVVLPIDQLGTSGTPGAASQFTRAGIAYFTPQYTEAEEMAEPLQQALGETVVVAVYPQENRIMVKGSAADLQLADEAVKHLDQPRPQVRITAMIYDVALGELERLGVTWNRQVRELANGSDEALGDITRTVSDFLATSSDLTTSGVTRVGIRTISNSKDASFFLEALDANSEAKLLADPSITVGDRRQASIKIVQEIPIIGANPVEGSNAVFTQTEFREAGVILNVMPRISRDGTIELTVQPEYSVVSEITEAGPVIDSRTADTVVRVHDGQMFVLGGLRQKNIIESIQGVPYLKELKWIGKLFRSHSTEVVESELIVFLRPELITPCYSGTPREQIAAEVMNDQLNRIPHAEPGPIIPCCRDPYCPNHHPRPRINGGGPGWEMVGGTGFGAYDPNTSVPLEVWNESEIPISVDPPVSTTLEAAGELETTTVEELHPPLHVQQPPTERP